MYEPRARGERKLSMDAPTTVFAQLATSYPVDVTVPPARKERMRKVALRCSTGTAAKVLGRTTDFCGPTPASNRHRER